MIVSLVLEGGDNAKGKQTSLRALEELLWTSLGLPHILKRSSISSATECTTGDEHRTAMIYAFLEYSIDTDARELRQRGEVHALEPQVFDLLVTLIEHRDRVMPRHELIERVWGGRFTSDSAVDARINAARKALGDSGKHQHIIRTVPRHGHRFVAPVTVTARTGPDCGASPVSHEGQRTHFCQSRDGTRIAFAQTGSGQALVRSGHYLTHLEHDWRSPVWQPFLAEMGRHFNITRYDQRGGGLSDWSVEDLCLERFVEDLEAVVDAAGLDQFVLYGASQGAPVSVAYAARHPERIARLILHGGYAQGRMVRGSRKEQAHAEAVQTLIRQGWGQPGSAFLKALSAMFMPGGSREQIDYLATMQQQSASAENAARLRSVIDRFDVTPLLGQIRVPTLVIHANNDSIHPLEQGRLLATGIPGAEFVMLDSPNHVLVEGEPAWIRFFETITS